MGIFADHAANFAKRATRAAHGAAGYAAQNHGDYKDLHGNMPSVREYVSSDAGRAAVRHSIGHGLGKFVSHTASKHFRKGNHVMGALMTFAGHALGAHLQNLKHDQRIFENVAKVRRGDPDVRQMTHNELREVRDHAHNFGGADKTHIHAAASGELERRHTNKGHEKAQAKIAHDNTVHSNRMAQKFDTHARTQDMKEAAHANKMRRIRDTMGHTSQARVASAEKLAQIRKGVEVAKTKGVQARQTSIRATHRSKLHLLKKTKSGGYYQGENGKKFYQSDEKMKKAATAPKGRKRAV